MSADQAARAARALFLSRRIEDPSTVVTVVEEHTYSRAADDLVLSVDPSLAPDRCVFTVKVEGPTPRLRGDSGDVNPFVVVFDEQSGSLLAAAPAPTR